LLAEHPAMEIEVDVSNQRIDLTRREADVAIRATRTPPDSLVGRKLATPGYAVYAAPSLLPRGKAPDLGQLRWIGFDERLAHLPVARWFDGVLAGARPRLRTDSLATMLRAAVTRATCDAGELIARPERVTSPMRHCVRERAS
jgi:hypothetical protein